MNQADLNALLARVELIIERTRIAIERSQLRIDELDALEAAAMRTAREALQRAQAYEQLHVCQTEKAPRPKPGRPYTSVHGAEKATASAAARQPLRGTGA